MSQFLCTIFQAQENDPLATAVAELCKKTSIREHAALFGFSHARCAYVLKITGGCGDAVFNANE